MRCGAELSKGAQAYWDSEAKTVTCLACLRPDQASAVVDRGHAGASAGREWHRRHDAREARITQKYGRLSGLVLALSDDPQSTAAWAYGANGETALGALLDPLRHEGMAVLHDRRLPGSKANIDHLVVAPSGVFVVDAKNYRGRVERIDRGGWFTTDHRLYVGGRDKTALVAGMAKQVRAVQGVLASHFTVPVVPVICFVRSDWSLFASPLRFGNVHVLWPRALSKLLRTPGTLTTPQIGEIERQLALTLRAA